MKVFILSAFLFCSIFVALPSVAQAGAENRVINLAGKQRMLSQKMSKEVLLVALEINKDENLRNLQRTRDLFHRSLQGLRYGDVGLGLPPTREDHIVGALKRVERLWRDFDLALAAILLPRRAMDSAVARISQKNLPLLEAMDDVVKLYEVDSAVGDVPTPLAKAINLAGRQRMLTQKMTKEFLLIAFDHDVEQNRERLPETKALFESTLQALIEGDEALGLDPAPEGKVHEQLKKVQVMWPAFQALLRDEPTPENLEALAAANLQILAEMDRAVSLYEAL